MKKKICVVTGSRSEYGLLRWLMQDIKDDLNLSLQLIVTGSHLLVILEIHIKKLKVTDFLSIKKFKHLLKQIHRPT